MGTIYEDHSRADKAYGRGDVSAIGGSGGSPLIVPPWNQASSWKGRKMYRTDLVQEAVRNHQEPEEIDPRHLHATQSHLIRAGVNHYLSGSKELYADAHQAGNQTPVVYARNNREGSSDMPDWWTDTDHILLSGHHRAAAALLRGEQFKAIVVRGPHGS